MVWLWGQGGGVEGIEQVPDASFPVASPPNPQCCTDTWGRGNGLSGHVPPITDPLRCVVFRMEKTKDLTAAEIYGWDSDLAGIICVMQVLPLLHIMVDDFTLALGVVGSENAGYKEHGHSSFVRLCSSLCPLAKLASSAPHMDIPRISANNHRAHFLL